MACGELKLKIDEYYELTQRQFYNILKGHNKHQQLLQQQSWEQARLIAYFSATFEKKAPSITKFLPFEWETEAVLKELQPTRTREQLKAHFDKLEK